MPRTPFRAVSAILLTLAVLHAPAAHAGDDPAPVEITVNARAGLADVPETGIGTNHAIWDTHLGSDETADLLKAAHVRLLRYPGGSYSDIYHWADHTAPGGYVAPNTDFDTFMAGVRRTGAQAMVTANYGTGTAEEAAAWVRYANVTKGYGVTYWEIGNENYGNGHYGAEWEADDHEDKSPAEYARHVVVYADAMKAVDPTIKIGAVLTTPANWPDAIVAEGDAGSWNDVVLSTAGHKIDFVILHWYPGALDRTGHIPDMIQLTRERIARHVGAERAARIGIAMTEFNTGSSSNGTNTQPGALAAADSYATLLAGGVLTVDWWNVHNGIGEVTEVEGHTDYGDFGLLSSAGCTSDGSVCEPPLNTPFAPYHALRMVGEFARPGDQFVRAAADRPDVSAHAARRPDGSLAVMLINTSRDSYTASLGYAGFTPASGAPTVLTHTNGATSITRRTTGTATSQVLPPLSLTTIVLRPAAPHTGPGAPGLPAATEVTDTTATLTWPPAAAGPSPIAKYEIHRQNGAVSEQLGETPGTTLTVRNLRPGTRYTVNVIARDTAGRTSWSSPPLTFTTPAPATGSCKVALTVQSDWASGYVGNIEITNTGAPVDGWTLAFTWPRAWQSLDSGWSAQWTESGRDVKAVSEPGNGRLDTGQSVTIGFVGSYSGPNVLPTVFTLNGRVCAAG